jgi:hypothetical protein
LGKLDPGLQIVSTGSTEEKDGEINMTNPIHPIGWETGREAPPAEIVKMMAIEMLSHRSDLQHLAAREGRDTSKQRDRLALAWDFERYAVALYVLAVQMDPTGYKVENISGLIELAEKHNIAMPDWMVGAAPTSPQNSGG